MPEKSTTLRTMDYYVQVVEDILNRQIYPAPKFHLAARMALYDSARIEITRALLELVRANCDDSGKPLNPVAYTAIQAIEKWSMLDND